MSYSLTDAMFDKLDHKKATIFGIIDCVVGVCDEIVESFDDVVDFEDEEDVRVYLIPGMNLEQSKKQYEDLSVALKEVLAKF